MKPDDIPEDVWRDAVVQFDMLYDADTTIDGGSEDGVCAAIAYSVLDERARCEAKVLRLIEERDEARKRAGKLHDYANMRDWQIMEATEALKPFARIAESESSLAASDADVDEWFRHDGDVLLVGDFRRAAAIFKSNKKGADSA